jgi:hypothetical protein
MHPIMGSMRITLILHSSCDNLNHAINEESAMIDTLDMFDNTDLRMITPDPAPAKKRGRPRTSSLSRPEQLRLANQNARHHQRAAKEELLDLLISLFVNPKVNIFEKDRVLKVSVPATKLAKAILLAAEQDAEESSYDNVNIIKKLKSSGGRTKRDLAEVMKDFRPL